MTPESKLKKVRKLIEDLKKPSADSTKSKTAAQMMLLNETPDVDELVNGLQEIEKNLQEY